LTARSQREIAIADTFSFCANSDWFMFSFFRSTLTFSAHSGVAALLVLIKVS